MKDTLTENNQSLETLEETVLTEGPLLRHTYTIERGPKRRPGSGHDRQESRCDG